MYLHQKDHTLVCRRTTQSTRHITMNQTAAFEAKVVEVCAEHEREHWKETNYRAAVHVETGFFVKFGDPAELLPEIETQKYIFDYAASGRLPNAPRIPWVVHSFTHNRTTYLVMEFITLMPTPPDFIAQMTAAVVWLASVPAPPSHVIGPLGGGRIRHRFFKEAKAPLHFSSVEALEQYISKAHTLFQPPSRKTLPPVQICDDRLMFGQSDMHQSNFGVDQDGRTVLMDFAEIGLLPETFVAHTMFSDERLRPIAAALGLSNGSSLSMSRISSFLWRVATPKLGLDEHGYPKDSQR